MPKSIDLKDKVSAKPRAKLPIFISDLYPDIIVNSPTYHYLDCSEEEKKQLSILIKSFYLPMQIYCLQDTQFQNLLEGENSVGALATINDVSIFNDGSWKFELYLEKRIRGISIEINPDFNYAFCENYNDITETNESTLMSLIEDIYKREEQNNYTDVYLPLRLPTEEFVKYATRCSLSFLSDLRYRNVMESSILENLCYSQDLSSRLAIILKHIQDN